MLRRAVCLLALVALWGCEDSATEPARKLTLLADQAEAELVALHLSGEIQAPPALADAVGEELRILRETYGAEIPEVLDLRHRAPWDPTDLLLVADEETARAILNEEYDAWDTLNETYGLQDIHSLRYDGFVLRFARPWHPCRLGELYRELPGMVLVEPNGIIGDSSNVHAWEHDGQRTYLFRKAWGDCPAGCISALYWYFRATESGPELVGSWDPQSEPNAPEWWAEARQNVEFHAGQCHK